MPDPRYPTLEEFWKRLDRRKVEPDLRTALRQRATQQPTEPARLPAATIAAVAARLLPGAVPAEVLAAFLDAHFDEQLGRADDRVGVLARAELIPAGFHALDEAARDRHAQDFASLAPGAQDDLLTRAEQGELTGPEAFDSATWFTRIRGVLFLAYGSDPRGMVEMGFPGPSYQPGHVWLDEGEVVARARRRKGYLVL